MKTFIKNICLTVCLLGLLSPAFAPIARGLSTNNADKLPFNFQNVPLGKVLSDLSDATGFIITLDSHVGGNITIASTNPVSQEEAVNLLNTELNKINYAAIRDGRMLNIVTTQEAKTGYIPVKAGNNPGVIPNNDELVTWIIPVRFIEAQELLSNLSPFISSGTTIVANESGNLILITDTQSRIRHLVKIIQAVDNSAEAETEIRVIRMKFATPADVVDVLSSAFPDAGNSGDSTFSPFTFGDDSGTANSGQTDRIKAATKVLAVTEARIQAVIVSAPKHLMNQITDMINRLDVPSRRDQKVYVYQLKNADPNQMATVLKAMFQTDSTSGTTASSAETSVLQQRAQTTLTSSSSTTSGTGGASGASSGRGGGF